METIINNFISDIRLRHRRKFLKLIYKPWIRNFRYGRSQLQDWCEVETSDLLCNLIPTDLVELRPPHSMSIRQAVRQTQLILLSPVKDKERTNKKEVL